MIEIVASIDSYCRGKGNKTVMNAIGRASLVLILRDVTRFTPLLVCLVQ